MPTWGAWQAGEPAQRLCLAQQHLDAPGRGLELQQQQELAQGSGGRGEDAAVQTMGTAGLEREERAGDGVRAPPTPSSSSDLNTIL